MFITGSFYCICKNMFMLLLFETIHFPDHWYCISAFLYLQEFSLLWNLYCFHFHRMPVADYHLFSLMVSFPCARRSFSISLFNSSSHIPERLFMCKLFSAFFFYCYDRLLHVLHPRRSVLYLQDYISYSSPISFEKICSKRSVSLEQAGIIISKCRKMRYRI